MFMFKGISLPIQRPLVRCIMFDIKSYEVNVDWCDAVKEHLDRSEDTRYFVPPSMEQVKLHKLHMEISAPTYFCQPE